MEQHARGLCNLRKQFLPNSKRNYTADRYSRQTGCLIHLPPFPNAIFYPYSRSYRQLCSPFYFGDFLRWHRRTLKMTTLLYLKAQQSDPQWGVSSGLHTNLKPTSGHSLGLKMGTRNKESRETPPKSCCLIVKKQHLHHPSATWPYSFPLLTLQFKVRAP